MALGNASFYGVANEIVIDNFMQLVVGRCGLRQWYVQFDIEEHALLAFFFEIVNADVAHYLIVAQKKSTTIDKARVKQ